MLQDRNVKRASEAADYIGVRDEINGKMPKWYDRLYDMYLLKFELD
jgi:hypothetical protein